MARILVVEDSLSIAEGLRWVLTDAGHDVLVINEGMRGLLDPEHPAWQGLDTILCDLMMPDVTGVEVLEAARKYAPMAQRIVLTGMDDTSEIRQRAAQIAHVYPKPMDWTDLLDAIAGGLHG